MNYLQPSEYVMYGLEATTAQGWATAASTIIESHCRRTTLGIAQYTERLRMQNGQRPVQLTYLPLVAVAPSTSPIVAARARYAAQRRGELLSGQELWETAIAFGIPGSWVDLDMTNLDMFAETGEVTLPVNVLGWSFNELEIAYTAGFDPIPNAVKVACAQLIKNAQATPALNVKRNVIPDRMQLMYFSDSLLDQTVEGLLAPYVSQKVG